MGEDPGLPLANRRAIVTGAGSGIGEAIAHTLADDGAQVVVADLDAHAAERVAGAIRSGAGRALAMEVDVAQEASVARLVAECVRQLGGVDLLVCNAGIGIAATVEGTSLEDWQRVLGVNLTGTFLCCRAAIPVMRRSGGGTIVAIASVAGQVGIRNRAAYCASKAGVVGLMRSIVADYAAEGIRACCVLPGTVDSPWIERILANQPDPAAERQRMEARQLIGRMGTPREIAAAVRFLASDAAAFAHGACLVVDGGMTAV